MSPTEPLDRTHSESVDAVRRIRRRLALVQWWVAQWEPRPCPSRAEWP